MSGVKSAAFAHPSARDAALLAVDDVPLPAWPPNTFRNVRLPALTDRRDFALAEQIRIGTLKNFLLIRRVIEHFAGRRCSSIDVPVQKILAIAVAQLRLLDRVPSAAAVDEAVNQTKRFRLSRASGFVNAVLRRVSEDPQWLPKANSPEDVAALHLSHPRQVFRKVAGLLGDDAALAFCRHSQAEPPTIIRSTDIDAALAVAPAEVKPHETPGLYVVRNGQRATFAAWANAGVAQVQDPTSAAVVPGLQIKSGMRVLDRCCGAGTKTLQLADAVGPDGHVVAMDRSEERIERLRSVLKARDISHVSAQAGQSLQDLDSDGSNAPFDLMLVDAPCSNSGVLARRPEARFAQGLRTMGSLSQLQRFIVGDSVEHVKLGGLLVYSTCSVWPEENEELIKSLLAGSNQFELSTQGTTWPASSSDETYQDGGFTAVLKRVR